MSPYRQPTQPKKNICSHKWGLIVYPAVDMHYEGCLKCGTTKLDLFLDRLKSFFK